MSLAYAAANPDGPLKNLVLFTTPVDQTKIGLATVWSDPRFLDIDLVVETLGVLPSEMVVEFFEMLRPAQRVGGQLRLADLL